MKLNPQEQKSRGSRKRGSFFGKMPLDLLAEEEILMRGGDTETKKFRANRLSIRSRAW